MPVQVDYDDGDRDELHLAMERVRLLMHAGETFVQPQAADLEVVANGLLTAANNKSALSPRTRARALSPSQEKLLQGQSGWNPNMHLSSLAMLLRTSPLVSSANTTHVQMMKALHVICIAE